MKFEKWVELRENMQGQVNPPEHTGDEDAMDIPALIERRLMMLIDEVEKKRNMPRDQQVEILTQVIQTLAGQFGLNKQHVQKATKGAFGNQGQPPQGDQPPPPMQQPQQPFQQPQQSPVS